MSREMKPFVPPTSLCTKRLVLRAAVRTDADDVFANYTGDPVASHYLQRSAHRDPSQTERVLATWGLENWSSGDRFAWSILKKNEKVIVGLFFLKLNENSAEIHFGIGRMFWSNGFAAEAGQAVMSWVVSIRQIDFVSTICDCENTASLKVLEKIGLRRTRFLPQHLFLPSMGVRRDCWLYAWERGRSTRRG